MSIYNFITQPYRFSIRSDSAVRSSYRLARSVEIDGFMTNLSDADAISTTIFNLLKAPRTRYEVAILGVNVITPSLFSGQTVCATLYQSRFNLSAGKVVIVTEYAVDLNGGQTVLRCWG